MQQTTPKCSIVVTTYNNAHYLPDAIASAAAQDYPNKDIYVVNDCSTDNTDKIMNQYEEFTYEPIGLFTDRWKEILEGSISHKTIGGTNLFYCKLRQNSGPSKGRNIAIADALRRGSHFIQVLDADDCMYKEKVSTLAAAILKNPQRIGIAYADYNVISEKGTSRYESKLPYDYQIFFNGTCIVHSGCLFNVIAIKDFFPYFYPEHLRVTEDYFLARRVLRSSQWIAVQIPTALTLVRSHSQDSTSSVSKEVWNECFRRTMTES